MHKSIRTNKKTYVDYCEWINKIWFESIDWNKWAPVLAAMPEESWLTYVRDALKEATEQSRQLAVQLYLTAPVEVGSSDTEGHWDSWWVCLQDRTKLFCLHQEHTPLHAPHRYYSTLFEMRLEHDLHHPLHEHGYDIPEAVWPSFDVVATEERCMRVAREAVAEFLGPKEAAIVE